MPSIEVVPEQDTFIVPDVTVKELIDVIPSHCFERSILRSSAYIVWDLAVIMATYKTAAFLGALVNASTAAGTLPTWFFYLAHVTIWSVYGFFAGLFATGLWVIAHECGHHAFSEWKTINHTVGWILHSAFGIPYHSWRITHAMHHASAGHMTEEQYYVPWTRSEIGLPHFDPSKGDLGGSHVAGEVRKELLEALNESPLALILRLSVYLAVGLPAYVMFNTSGQGRYPKGTNLLNPRAAVFTPRHYWLIILSDLGIFLWLFGITTCIYTFGFLNVFIVYLIPYLWVNHWIVLITFLQHTDPLLPHYRPPAYTHTRGALATFDRNVLGGLGPLWGSLGAHATNGIAETHVVHHICSRVPHYHAWEASKALKTMLATKGIHLDGKPVGWGELYRVLKECKFVEDEGDVLFFKNAQGFAKLKPVFVESNTTKPQLKADEPDL